MKQPRRRSPRPGKISPGPSGSADNRHESPEPEFLIVGRVIRPHGVRGDLAVKVITDYPERLGDLKRLYLGPEHVPYQVKRVREYKEGVLILLEEVADRNAAELLRDKLVFVHIDDAVPLEEGEYYIYQLYGIRVVTDVGQELGHLTDILETGANDVYVITGEEGEEILLPAIPDVILNVDISTEVMTVKLIDGLI